LPEFKPASLAFVKGRLIWFGHAEHERLYNGDSREKETEGMPDEDLIG